MQSWGNIAGFWGNAIRGPNAGQLLSRTYAHRKRLDPRARDWIPTRRGVKMTGGVFPILTSGGTSSRSVSRRLHAHQACNLRYLRAIFEASVRFAAQPSNEPVASSCNLRPARGRPWRNCPGRVVPGAHLNGVAGLVGSIARHEWPRNAYFGYQSQKLKIAWHRSSVCATAKSSDLSEAYPT